MRELKFRAWDKSQKYMAYQGSPDLETLSSFMFHFGEDIVLQSTGFLDKNENEIFEGDIIRGLNDKDIEEYYVVMWIEQRAAFYMVPAVHYCVLKDNDLSNDDDFNWLFDDAMLYDFSSDCSLTNVGNIHDNKDLLK